MAVKEKLLSAANKILSNFNRSIVMNVTIDREKKEKWIEEFLFKQTANNQKNILLVEDLSKSQLKQDFLVLSELNFKTKGYFIEFGATDGVGFSNSFLLEKHFGWNGILSEPSKRWHNQLKKNRNCSIETNCVWSKSNETLDFFDAKNGLLSTVNKFANSDFRKREKMRSYKVTTISLRDMLIKHDAPKNIDYLSIDTEGSEYEILKDFDFNEYNIKVITVEHNYTEMREKIYELLTKFNYVRKYKEVSQCDDWYVRQ